MQLGVLHVNAVEDTTWGTHTVEELYDIGTVSVHCRVLIRTSECIVAMHLDPCVDSTLPSMSTEMIHVNSD